MVRMRTLALLVISLALGCTKPATEVVVITTTDFDVPAEVDEMQIEVTSPRGEVMSANADLRDRPPPRSLGITPTEGGALGPYQVRARALSGGGVVVERVAVFDFQRDQVRVLRIELLRSCMGVTCGADETCARGACRSVQVAADELEDFEGLPDAGPTDAGDRPDAGSVDAGSVDAGPFDAGPFDAGPFDAGMCVPMTETCNMRDDDCDGVPDNGFDLTTDSMNCGTCGSACAGTCIGGMCDGACPSGMGDCDGDPSNGCEADLTTNADHCGMCGDRCRGMLSMCCMGMCC